MKKIFISIICILLLCIGVVFFGTEKTTATIDSFTTNLCQIGNFTYGQRYLSKYVIDEETYFGNSECTKMNLSYGEKVNLYYAKFNKRLNVPYYFLMGVLSGLTGITVLIFGILLIVDKRKVKE